MAVYVKTIGLLSGQIFGCQRTTFPTAMDQSSMSQIVLSLQCSAIDRTQPSAIMAFSLFLNDKALRVMTYFQHLQLNMQATVVSFCPKWKAAYTTPLCGMAAT